MRFTATSKFNAIARGAAKVLRWRVYCKKTSTLSEALNAGTWIEVSSRIQSIPPARSSIEYDLGIFKSDSITLTAKDIDWWEANILNLSAGQSLELKIEVQIGLDRSDLATDVVYAFSGWVDIVGINPNELDDTLTLKVYTADDLANRMSAESIVTRYVSSDVDGVGTEGIILKHIPGIWVIDANITSYVLKAGIHTITFDYNGGTERAKLDDGEWVELPTVAGTAVLANKEDDERIQIYVIPADLYTLEGELVDDLIVPTAGETLPFQWYRTISSRKLLSKCFTAFGVTSQTFDDLLVSTYNGLREVSYLDVAPDDPDILPPIQAMASKDDDTIYVAVGAEVYARNYDTQVYTLLGTMASDVDRLFYDATNDWLWIVYGVGTKLKVYRFATSDLSTEHTFTATADVTGIDLFKANDSIIFTTTADTIRHIVYNGTTFTDAELFTAGGLTPAFTSIGTWGRIGNANTFYFNGVSAGQKTVHYISWGGASWTDGADFSTHTDDFTYAAFDVSDLEIYYWDSVNRRMRGLTSSTEVTVIDLVAFSLDVQDVYYDPVAETTYFTTILEQVALYSIRSEVATLEQDEDIESIPGTLTSNDTYLFGAAPGRRLWQFGTTLAMFVEEADMEGMTIKAALNKCCQAFNLVYHISSIKAAYVYRRGDDNGTPQTSGNTLTLNSDLAENISKDNLYGKAYGYIRIDNKDEAHSYDGTTGPVVFDKGVFGEVRKLEITNDWIPTPLILHLLFQMWQFFETDRSLYRIPTNIVTLFQYEILDQLTANFSTRKIGVNASGPIMGQTLYQDGSMDVEALI